jgi:glycosyltransferase involved in cell wall biosynthesis
VFVAAGVVLQASGKGDVIPNVLLEAMASGVAVIATHVGGVRELVRDGESGWLVPANDAAALTGALDALLGDPWRRRKLAVGGRRHVASHFDHQRLADALAARLLTPLAMEPAVDPAR